MKFRWGRFNLYLPLLAAALLAACETTQPGGAAKAASGVATLRIHLETNPDNLGLSRSIVIGGERPQAFSITPPKLSEEQLASARLWEGPGGEYALLLKFDREGTRMLEMLSASYRGKRLAVGGQFPEARWLGAFRMERHIADGTLLVRPDATRDEAEKFVRLLNNTVAKLKKYKD